MNLFKVTFTQSTILEARDIDNAIAKAKVVSRADALDDLIIHAERASILIPHKTFPFTQDKGHGHENAS